jgi:hypothetical protein
MAPRPTQLPYSLPAPWTEKDGLAIHTGALSSLPEGTVLAGTRWWPMIPRPDDLSECSRYAVALGTNDATAAVASLKRTFLTKYLEDPYSEVASLVARGRVFFTPGTKFGFAMWAADRSHGALVEYGASLRLTTAWMDRTDQLSELIVVTYVQRCALR